MTDEEYVRSVWVEPALRSMRQAGFVVTPSMSKLSMITAAAEFTREHKEKVRQLRREIEVITEYTFSVEEMLGMAQINADRPGVGFDAARDHHAMSRILARLESALATLTAGMKPDVQP